jgi:hypothetical protein
LAKILCSQEDTLASRFRPYTFTHIHVVGDETASFGAMDDELAEQNLDHALILRLKGTDWAHKSIETAVAGSWALERDRRLLNVGVDGNVFIFEFPGTTMETIDGSERGPSELVTIRTVRGVGGKVYAAGMARMVYRREGDGQWVAVDAGTFVPRGERDKAEGFLAIDGRSAREIYAAGYQGEIWFYDEFNWERQDSPTNVALTTMAVTLEGDVHIAGLAGIYIVGRRGAWRVIEHHLHENDFWGMTFFDGYVYSATLNGIFCYVPDGLEPVDLNLERHVSTAYLDARGGVMWSAGHKDLLRTNDGVTWTAIATP